MKKHEVKPRLPLNQVVFEEEYQEQTVDVIGAYDRVQADYAGRVRPQVGVSAQQNSLVKLNQAQLEKS